MKYFLPPSSARSFFFIHVSLLTLLYTCTSCSSDDPGDPVRSPSNPLLDGGKQVWVINEGNFTRGNASLDIYDADNESLSSNVFQQINNSLLGDVFQSAAIFQDRAYLVINNSNKIEVVDPDSFVSIGTINGLVSPRFFLPINSEKAYVSDLFGDAVAIVHPTNLTIEGEIRLPGWSEQMVLVGTEAFVTNVRRPYLYVIETLSDEIVDSIAISEGGGRIVLDANETIWVGTGGLLQDSVKGFLYHIDPVQREVVASFEFPGNQRPAELTINGAGTNLYYLNQGVFVFPITAQVLPTNAVVQEDRMLFYGLGIDPENEEIYVADAIDFVQRGLILRYQSDGTLIDEFLTGIIPGRFLFPD